MLSPANPGLFAQAVNLPHRMTVRVSVLERIRRLVSAPAASSRLI